MKFLFVSDFVRNADSGAAGSIEQIGRALIARGNQVTFCWHDASPFRLPQARLGQLLELPARQRDIVRAALERAPADVVVVSQPYAYKVYQELPKQFPQTLFLNRTHGWEARRYDALQRFGIERDTLAQQSTAQVMSKVMERICAATAIACDGVIAAASGCADYIRTVHRVPHERVAVIPYGLDPEFFEARATPHRDRERLRLIFAGQWLPVKGTRVLRQVLPKLARERQDFDVTFVVNHEAVPVVQKIFEPSLRGRLTVSGWMPRADLRNVYREHDVFLFPTFFEGFGKTFLEAMASGLCVVGFAEGGLPDIAASGMEALFCEPGDVKTFEAQLRRCLDDRVSLDIMRTQASERARRFTWDATAAATEAFCHRLGHGRFQDSCST